MEHGIVAMLTLTKLFRPSSVSMSHLDYPLLSWHLNSRPPISTLLVTTRPQGLCWCDKVCPTLQRSSSYKNSILENTIGISIMWFILFNYFDNLCWFCQLFVCFSRNYISQPKCGINLKSFWSLLNTLLLFQWVESFNKFHYDRFDFSSWDFQGVLEDIRLVLHGIWKPAWPL